MDHPCHARDRNIRTWEAHGCDRASKQIRALHHLLDLAQSALPSPHPRGSGLLRYTRWGNEIVRRPLVATVCAPTSMSTHATRSATGSIPSSMSFGGRDLPVRFLLLALPLLSLFAPFRSLLGSRANPGSPYTCDLGARLARVQHCRRRHRFTRPLAQRNIRGQANAAPLR